MDRFKRVLYKIGIPPNLAWGYLGVLIFMLGDGIEQGWLSPYLVESGFSIQQSASLLTIYGITVTFSAWISGVLVDILGPKRTMTLGLVFFLLGSITFISLGLQQMNLAVMYPAYAIRGFGYPLFAYSFLVWITYSSPKEKLGGAVGWFWFVFSGGLFVIGVYSSSFLIPLIGHIHTLWTSIVWVLIGSFFALFLNKDVFVKRAEKLERNMVYKELLKGILIIKEEPRVLLGGIIRVINSLVVFSFPVFIPIYLLDYGYSTTDWLKIWGTFFSSNIIFNLIFGYVGDRLGWKRTIMWFGGIGTAISTVCFYYTPQLFPNNDVLLLLVSIITGATIAGYVPLSALIPTLVKDNKGAAMAILNLGAGLPAFAGPALVGLLIGPIGSGGVIWVLAGLYLISALLTHFLDE